MEEVAKILKEKCSDDEVYDYGKNPLEFVSQMILLKDIVKAVQEFVQPVASIDT